MPTLILLLLTLVACTSDPTDGNPPPPQDVQPFDLAADATDAQRVDVGDDRPGPMDAGADAGFDVGFEAAAQEIPGPDVVDAGVTDAGSDVPADARISCGALPAEPACTTSAQCAMCQPASSGEVWCCRANGTCGVSPNVFVCP